MLILKPSDIRPSEITREEDYLSRRQFISAAMNAGLAGAAAGAGLLPAAAPAQTTDRLDYATGSPYSAVDEELTPFEDITTYNNFLEFGLDKKDASRHASALTIEPWSVAVEGECAKPGVYAYEDVIRPHQLEERIYRLRCVEAWSMVIPWVGIPLGDVLKRYEPDSSAKFVEFTTVARPEEMPGLKTVKLDWPYLEGLRMDEAMHPLSLLAVGLYGHELMNQNGAPIRLVVPWKYGFKSIKSIVRIRFVREQPVNTWQRFDANAYGFYANVNPEVDHPDWSQARERRIGSFFKQDTVMFNGYGEQVASMYSGMDLTSLF